MRHRLSILWFLSLAALALVAGCERSTDSPFTAEDDDSDYRRGEDLLRQGRDQEALAAFQQVIDRRAGDAPESQLDLGILYEQHIKDPIAAIYHYRKYLELQPNSKKADYVRQRIDAATRDFASTLPVQPLGNQLDLLTLRDKFARLQAENAQLRAQLGASASAFNVAARPLASGVPPPAPDAQGPLAINPADSPVAPAPPPKASASQAQKPQKPAANVRQHTVVRGDTLASIARHYYGNKARWQQIYEANRDVMKNQNDLKIGMVLKIP